MDERIVVLSGARRAKPLSSTDDKAVNDVTKMFYLLDVKAIASVGLNVIMKVYVSNRSLCIFDEVQWRARDWTMAKYQLISFSRVARARKKSESGAGRWSVIKVPTCRFMNIVN